MVKTKTTNMTKTNYFSNNDYALVYQGGQYKLINRQNLLKRLDTDKSGNFINVTMSQDFTPAQLDTDYTLPFDTVYDVNGDGLTLQQDGSIRVGANVHHVLVSGQVYSYTFNASAYELICYFLKNDHLMVTHNQYIQDRYEHVSMPTIAVSVQEGDTIRMQVREETDIALIRDYHQGTFFNVVVLD